MNNVFYKEITHQIAGYGIYKNVKWTIISVMGSHPCAYIEDKIGKDYEKIKVHGGITFYDNCYFNKEEENIKYIGWDYAHCTDFIAFPTMPNFENPNHKKWTYEEIKNEVFNAIDQMLNLVKEAR